MLSVIRTSDRKNWRTPAALFAFLDQKYKFTLDAAAEKENALCATYFDASKNGLSQTWSGNVFLNPPFGSALLSWISKASRSVIDGDCNLVACVLPSRTDTRWWHDIVMPNASEIYFIKNRLYFDDGDDRCPFACCVVVFSASPDGPCFHSIGPFPKLSQTKGEQDRNVRS